MKRLMDSRASSDGKMYPYDFKILSIACRLTAKPGFPAMENFRYPDRPVVKYVRDITGYIIENN